MYMYVYAVYVILTWFTTAEKLTQGGGSVIVLLSCNEYRITHIAVWCVCVAQYTCIILYYM